MTDVLIVEAKDAEATAVVLGKLYAQALGKPYPIPGVRVNGGIHGDGGETLYAVSPIESQDGAQVAFEVIPELAAHAGKDVHVDGKTETLPAKQAIDVKTWAKAEAVAESGDVAAEVEKP